MSQVTQIPPGITRDDTEPGKLYYTQQQLIEYGSRCAADFMRKIDLSRIRSNASGQSEVTDVEAT